MMTRPAAESWQLVEQYLARPPVAPVAGQLAAFPLDMPDHPLTLSSVDDSDAQQLALFDPEVTP